MRAFTEHPASFPALVTLKTPISDPYRSTEMPEDEEISEEEFLRGLCAVAPHAQLKKLILYESSPVSLFGANGDAEMWRNLPNFIRQNLKMDISNIYASSGQTKAFWIFMPPEMAGSHPDVYNLIFDACYKPTDELAQLAAVSTRLDHGAMQPVALPWMVKKLEPIFAKAHAKDLVEGDAKSEEWFHRVTWTIMHLMDFISGRSLVEPLEILKREFHRLIAELGFSKYLSLVLRSPRGYSTGTTVLAVLSRLPDEKWNEYNVTDALLSHPEKGDLLSNAPSTILDRLQKSRTFKASIVIDSPEARHMALMKLIRLDELAVVRDAEKFDSCLSDVLLYVSSHLLPERMRIDANFMLPFFLRSEDSARRVGTFYSDFHLLVHCPWAWRAVGAMNRAGIEKFKLALEAHAQRFLSSAPWDEEYFLECLWIHYALQPDEYSRGEQRARIAEVLALSTVIPRRAVEILSTSSRMFVDEYGRHRLLEYIISTLPADSPALPRLRAAGAGPKMP